MKRLVSLVRRIFAIDANLEQRVTQLEHRFFKQESKMATIHDLIASLKDKVSSQTTVIQSVLTQNATLSQALKDAQAQVVNTGDVSLLQDVISGLDQNNQALAEAVASNTSAANEQPPAATDTNPVTTDTPLQSVASTTPADASSPAPTDNSSSAGTDANATSPSAAPADPNASAPASTDNSSAPAAAPADNSAPAATPAPTTDPNAPTT